jgi:hypothetical protein
MIYFKSTYVFPVTGKKDAFIFMADKWTLKDAIDGRYLWLPITFNGDDIAINCMDKWDLSIFGKPKN